MTNPNQSAAVKACLAVAMAALLAWAGLMLFFAMLGRRGEKPQRRVDRPAPVEESIPDPAGRENMAFIQACEFVKGRLRAPGAADFPWLDFEARHDGGGIYFVRSYVDAQNAFGGEVRETWKATVRYKGGEPGDIRNWELLSLIIGDRRVAP